ncbi:MAG: nucleotidyl transferase AbiEii/AbiGii toxin family protein [Aestuariibacter sp.]
MANTMLNILVDKVLAGDPQLLGLTDVVEKEILHHDIMQVLHKEGCLQRLTFIGGTSLRLCYHSNRLSEDLDFTAGIDFVPSDFNGLESRLEEHLQKKYDLNVKARKPKEDNSDTATWKITIEKYKDKPHLPSQKMHIDICALPSFEVEYRPIRDHYNINSPMTGLPIPVQSMKEIMADKMIAFAFRERRIKPRDVWDILWLNQQGISQSPVLIAQKLGVRKKPLDSFLENIDSHALLVRDNAETKQDFYQEMSRFIPKDVAERTLGNTQFWLYARQVITDEVSKVKAAMTRPGPEQLFDMKM